jgi:hypothetical protein
MLAQAVPELEFQVPVIQPDILPLQQRDNNEIQNRCLH